jgi:hypothetical protein
MRIEFSDGSLASQPAFDRYLSESTAPGAVPVRFECAATAGVSDDEISARADDALEQRAREEEADILPATVVATRLDEPSGHRRYRVLAIALRRRPVVETVIVREEVDPSSA